MRGVGLGLRLGARELTRRRGASLSREDRRLLLEFADDQLMGEIVEAVMADEINTTTELGPNIPAEALPAFGDGALIEIFRNAFRWILEPENQQKLIALIRLITSLFGVGFASGGRHEA